MKYGNLIDLTKAISNMGNVARINDVYKKAKNGEPITVVFIGGSITNGSLASAPDKCYAYKVFEWWKDEYGSYSNFEYVNAGIGATDSQYGCARADVDVLGFVPDVVFIEFSVNDENNIHFMETYEGLVRKIYYSEIHPAVILIHNVRYDNGYSAEDVHSIIGRYYEIPSVSMRSTILPLVKSGQIPNRDITPDDLHPNDEGHAMVAKVVTTLLDDVQFSDEDISEERLAESYVVKKPLTVNGYEDSVLYNNESDIFTLNGFIKDTEEKRDITDIFKRGFQATKVGDSITFNIEASSIAVQYRKTISKPAPIAKAVVDGDEDHPIILDANFTETWGDKLELTTLLEHGELKNHTVTISIIEDHEDDKLPFYLVSVIGSK